MYQDYLAPNQVERLFPGLTAPRLARWRWAKTGPAYAKVGKQVLYRKEVIEAFLAEREVGQ